MHTITHLRAGMRPRVVTPAAVGAWLLALSFLALTTPLCAATLNVPSQYSTIQAAINAAANGDTVQLAAGTYTGSGNVDLDFGGKNITVNGSGAIVTIIDCAATSTSYHRAFNFHSGETGAQVRRLTIRRGYQSSGGAISLASGCALTVTSCIFSTNQAAGSGGAIVNASGATITLANCSFTNNQAKNGTGAALANSGNATLTNSILYSNTAFNGNGGAIYSNSQLTLEFCTLAYNSTSATGTQGGALENDGTATVTDDIFWSNTAAGHTGTIGTAGNPVTTVTYCDNSGISGMGNITVNPSFVLGSDNLHLQIGSGCIGQGTAIAGITTDKDSKARTTPPTMGAYEGAELITRMLWDNTNGQASLWTINADNSFTAYPTYGPYTGWTAKAISVDPNEVTHILWTNTNGQASVWNVASDGSFTQRTFGPYSGWTAISISTSPSGVTHLLWAHSGGQASLWTLDDSAAGFTQVSYGPYTGWAAVSVADGPDVTDMLWNNANGTALGWRISSSGTISNALGRYSGWGAVSLSVDPNDGAHLLWDNTNGATNGEISLWNVDIATDNFTQTSYGPYTGWAARAVATGPDNVNHILWNYAPNGEASLWNLSGSSKTNHEYGPFAGWTAIAVSSGP